MQGLLLVTAILPVLLLGVYIYRKDRNKEPKTLLIKLFTSGIISCFLALLISIALTYLFPFLTKNQSTMTFLEFSFYIFVFIALIEESCKWIMTYYLGYKNKEFDEVYDIIVYAVFVALGFAAFENILYVFQIGSVQVGIMRGILAIPGHVCDGIAMGYYLSLMKYYERLGNKKEVQSNKIKSLLIPVLYHGIYDYCCLVDNDIVLIAFILFIVFLYTTSLKKVKKLSSQNLMINRNNYCPYCGTKVEGNYCSNCGKKKK